MLKNPVKNLVETETVRQHRERNIKIIGTGIPDQMLHGIINCIALSCDKNFQLQKGTIHE
jgi:hypothetical protein